MIVLDTNVVSELMRPNPDEVVGRWARAIAGTELFTTSFTIAEILFGIVRLPEGRRKAGIRSRWDEVLVIFGDRILDFDAEAAAVYADIAAGREAAGRPIHIADGQIAAVCRRHGATLATRNVTDFDGLDLELVNPFD